MIDRIMLYPVLYEIWKWNFDLKRSMAARGYPI